MQKQLSYNPVNKIQWKMILDIEKILLGSGLYIFGGYVRDKILHIHHANMFYEKTCKSQEFLNNIQTKYSDKTYLPEHNDRSLIPTDIDCFGTNVDIYTLIETFRKSEYILNVKKTKPAKFYLQSHQRSPNIQHVFHTKIAVKFNIPKLLLEMIDADYFIVNLDLLHTTSTTFSMFDFMTSNYDFDCNSLVITPDSEYKLSSCLGKNLNADEKLEKITKIIANIKNKVAKTLPYMEPPIYRLIKMIKKGWQIKTNYLEFINNDKYDGHCLICHGDFENKDLQVKDHNCDARFHLKCFEKMINFGNYTNMCPMCKNDCYVSQTENLLIKILSSDCNEQDNSLRELGFIQDIDIIVID